MARIFSFYEYFNILSIDIVWGAIISNLFIANILEVELPWVCVIVLGLTVWLIYTGDHLMDARRLQKPAPLPRHFFHQKHFRALSIIEGVVFCIILFLLGFLPGKVLLGGGLLILLVGGYFWLLHIVKPSWFPKEIIITLIYSIAVFLAPIAVKEGSFNWKVPVVFLEYILLALSNLLLIVLYEKARGRHEQQFSILQLLPEKWVRMAINGSLSAILSFNLIYFIAEIIHGNFSGVPLVFIGMTLTLGLVLWRPGIFAINERYRKWGDAVFLYPLIYLIW